MFGLFKKKNTLADECRVYLEDGPPASMTSYIPGSITEMIIAQGAASKPLDDELREVAAIIMMEANFEDGDYDNAEAEAYMKMGFSLVERVLNKVE